MKVDVKELSELKRQVSIVVPAETIQDEIGKKYAELRKNVTIKGFRKGKAPMDRIKAQYDDSVKAEVTDEVIRSTFPKVIMQEELKVASYPTVTYADFAEDGDLLYIAEVEVFPKLDQILYDDLEVTVEEIEVEDDDVDEFVEVLRKRFSTLRPVDREVQDSDVVIADLKKLWDPGMALSDDSFENQEIDLGNNQTVSEFKEQLPGMKSGDEKEIEVNYPDDYPDSTFAGTQLKYSILVRDVTERILPEFDDAFAKQTNLAETALELRLKIREDIKSRIDESQDKNKRSQIIDQVCEKNKIPVPESLMDSYLGNIVEEFKKRYKDVDEKEIRKSYRDVGIKTIRWNILYHKLSEQEEIEVLPADTEDRIKRFANHYQMSFEEAKENLAKSGTVADIKDSILEEKVLDFLVNKAKVNNTGKTDK
ncbi:MAG: trigger factor [candidate division Zixibacteria bacterium]|nr:trigger factor [candidate division Zixibacteria bacterium]